MNAPINLTSNFGSGFDDSGYMTPKFKIEEHLNENEAAVIKLKKLTSILTDLDQHKIDLEKNKLAEKLLKVKGFTKKIIDHATNLHDDYTSAISKIAIKGKMNKEGLSKYFIQGWYHTRYTPKFEHMFTQHLAKKANTQEISLDDINDKENKFTKMIEHNIDEEEGHEIWALQDTLFLGVKDNIDVMTDVFPETKAIVWSQHDRLTRLPFIGFLGYSFYLEFMIATRSLELLEILNKVFGTNFSDHKFIYYHYIVDQGHAIDNIELLDRMVQSEDDCKEVIDNMNFIHTMYKGLTLRSFSSE